MTKHFADYYWKAGKPYGISPLADDKIKSGISYKIVSDPYYKRISIENYEKSQFAGIAYDSALFDFRHLKPAEQAAWQKSTIIEMENSCTCHIRNQDDRLILVEEYRFQDNLCRECCTFSPHGVLVSIQNIYYESLKDPFNGVILYDSNKHIVMFKRYKIDEATQTFSELIEESWDGSSVIPLP